MKIKIVISTPDVEVKSSLIALYMLQLFMFI